MDTILFGTDGSPSADAALEFAIELCRDTGAALRVLAVEPPRLVGRAGALPILEIEQPGGARRIAEAAVDQARNAGVPALALTGHGNPADVIAEEARTSGADLVVVGSRGLGTVGALLMGSVSRALVTRADVPVTVVLTQHERVPAAV
jgi:nucleotide-binding universal stress UspA family protein